MTIFLMPGLLVLLMTDFGYGKTPFSIGEKVLNRNIKLSSDKSKSRFITSFCRSILRIIIETFLSDRFGIKAPMAEDKFVA